MTTPPKPSAEEQAPAPPGRVLLVDDQDELRQLLRRALLKDRHEVVSASNGRAAVQLAKNSRFDVVISDVCMPDMGGVELLRELHEHDVDLPVLLVSGSPDLDTAMKAVEYGAFEYLVKPVALDKLRKSAWRAIELRRQREENLQVLEQHRASGRHEQAQPLSEPRASWTGVVLAGRYHVGRLLGKGGMGGVYEATCEEPGEERVAVKVLHESLASDASLLLRFRREAQTVGQIAHPNIVRILDFRAEPGEPAFLVMERLHGLSLRQEMRSSGLFAACRAVLIARQMLAALSEVHRARVIHRDVKPENVLLTSAGGLVDVVKLVDFGVAKVLAAPPGETLTQSGTVLGTPTYMAPEHARGAAVDARSDVYSVAAIMYEALTGKPPFSGDNYNALLFAIQQGQPAPLGELRPDLPPGLIAVIARGMAPDAGARFQSADEMHDALAPWQHAGVAPDPSDATLAPTIRPTTPR